MVHGIVCKNIFPFAEERFQTFSLLSVTQNRLKTVVSVPFLNSWGHRCSSKEVVPLFHVSFLHLWWSLGERLRHECWLWRDSGVEVPPQGHLQFCSDWAPPWHSSTRCCRLSIRKQCIRGAGKLHVALLPSRCIFSIAVYIQEIYTSPRLSASRGQKPSFLLLRPHSPAVCLTRSKFP